MNPNFFLIGVAKAGTTAVFENLKNSSDVFFPHVKEPKHLSVKGLTFPFKGPGDDEAEKNIVKERTAYLSLFEEANANYACDASVDSFYYADTCINEISKLCTHPKIVLILRNPYERMYSAYQHLVRDGREQLSFAEALKAEELRISENYEFIWHYLNASLYADRLAKWKSAFPDMLVLLKDDLDSDPNSFYSTLCNYLEIPIPEVSNIRFNSSGKPKNALLHRFLNSTDNPAFQFTKRMVRSVVGGRATYLLKSRINSQNLVKEGVVSSDYDLVVGRVNEDITRTSEIIGRRMDQWLR
ncbi:sulfotransferase [Phaeocystidibacter luteus]|uniref:Sulfotransferase n=1 Tax=Phaeocystidibacter luteus TaxID=911197 RepID=A0A6N6RMP3_9FLAO|nr:sulfotransferase [Phaeocystidibacter luteus]KAB2814835.1 sulfotransferase [Phaeocystidibacter luteus]